MWFIRNASLLFSKFEFLMKWDSHNVRKIGLIFFCHLKIGLWRTSPPSPPLFAALVIAIRLMKLWCEILLLGTGTLLCFVNFPNQLVVNTRMTLLFTPQPSGLDGYCRHGPGRRVGGRLPDLRNPYLCKRLTDFLHLKFCGIVQASSCALLWSFAHLPHMGLPMGQKLVKFATNWVQTLRIPYLWNRWMDVPHLKFHGLIRTCSCALS